jgi:antibiotic biosynthesis monooxygenase (ABM) superfamily enzyme
MWWIRGSVSHRSKYMTYKTLDNTLYQYKPKTNIKMKTSTKLLLFIAIVVFTTLFILVLDYLFAPERALTTILISIPLIISWLVRTYNKSKEIEYLDAN